MKKEPSLTKRVTYLENEVASLERKMFCKHERLKVTIDSDGYLHNYATCENCGTWWSYKPLSGRKFTKQVKEIFRHFAYKGV